MNVIAVILAGVLWGSMSIFVRGLDNCGFDSRQIMMMRSLISAFLLGVIIFIKDKSLLKMKLRHLWIFLCTGIVSLSFFSVCYFSSILESGAGVAVVLLYTSPVFVLVLAAIFFKEKITRFKVTALVLTVAGCILVAGVAGTDTRITLRGLLLGLGSGLGYGLYSIFGTVALRKYKPLTVTFYTFLVAGLFMIPVAGPDTFTKVKVDSLFWFGGVAVFCTLLPFLLYTWGLKGLSAGKAAIFATVEPLVGTLVGVFVAKEQLSPDKLLGMALIFAAIMICQRNVVPGFLKKHGFKSRMIVRDIIFDMSKAGISGKKDDGKKTVKGQDMFRTWMLPPEKNPSNEKVIVIDAGGTNFRSCLVTFDIDGKAIISDFNKTNMPALDREYSRKEFFEAVADRIEHLRGKADKIGFCFSYAMNITKDHDGIPNAFSKEIKAKEVLGVKVGESLVEELEARGWNKIKKITLLNDTVGALLAGCAKENPYKYDSFIGFILGTGMNAAFIDEDDRCHDGRQIIVCESGKCNEIKLSEFDIKVDEKTDIPGQYPLEKCCSGAYLGKVGYEILSQAAREKLFSKETCRRILAMDSFRTSEMNQFLQTVGAAGSENGKIAGKIGDCCAVKADRYLMFELLDAAVDRCAKYAASILAANLIVCGRGKNKKKPVCIVLNGTTLYKTWRLKERMEKYLYRFATRRQHIYYETVCIEDDITLGTAVAALIKE